MNVERRVNRTQSVTNVLLEHLFRKVGNDQIKTMIQCGLGGWEEGPVLLKLLPNVKMMAVEPIHRYCQCAYHAGFRGPIIQAALWGKTGELLSLADERIKTSAFRMPDEGSMVFQTYTVTLDDAVRFANFNCENNLLWMDAEGAELEILNGGGVTILNTEAVICELNPYPYLPGWANAKQVIEKLGQLGFYLVKCERHDGLFLRKV